MTDAEMTTTPATTQPRIAVFGATRGIGRHVLELAAEAGYPVTALARDATSLEPGSGLRIVEGDATDPAAVDRAIAGADAVLIALGAPALSRSTVRSEGTRQIVESMKRNGVSRLVCVSVYGAAETRAQLPFFLRRVVFPTYLRRPVAEHERQEKIVRASGLRWTIVRPPNLVDGPRTGAYLHGDFAGVKGLSLTISRRDVADFMMRQLKDDANIGAAVGLSYRAVGSPAA